MLALRYGPPTGDVASDWRRGGSAVGGAQEIPNVAGVSQRRGQALSLRYGLQPALWLAEDTVAFFVGGASRGQRMTRGELHIGF